jgi:glutathione-specific gamma-glutamylcyclotransferase
VWVFGYGSLMWDNWERDYDCVRRVIATLPGFRRAFNKASVKNWGTKEHPGPTLNLAADDSASCTGVAFEFPEDNRNKVLADLKRREGKGFEFKEQRIQLQDGEWVDALVPIYTGPNTLTGRTAGELAEMARVAAGTHGVGIDYVRNVAVKLAQSGIKDPAVEDFLAAIQGRRNQGRTAG